MSTDREYKRFDSLRYMAEQLIANQLPDAPGFEVDDVEKIIHELQVYQTELDIQNQELRNTQSELERSRNKYFELFDLVPVGYYLLDQSYRVEEANAAAVTQIGVDRNAIKGRPFLNHVRSRDHRNLVAFLDSLEISGNRKMTYIDIKRHDGTYIHTRIDCIRSEPGVISEKHILLTVTDISELQRTQNALQESESLYRSLVHSSVDHIFMLSTDGYFLASNDRTGQFGIGTGDQIIGRNIADLYPPEESKEYIDQLNRVVSRHEAVTFEHQLTIDGSKHFHVDRLYPIIKGDKLWAVGGICHDITNLKQAQLEKEKLKNRLHQAQKMESIGTLAGGIAHDFNNILTSIIGFTELALEDAEAESILEENLFEVLAAGKRAKDLVNRILMFARQTDEPDRPIQVYKMVQEVLKLLRSSIPSTVEIRSDIRSKSSILGNPTHVHQILMNLCTNAAQAMEENGGILDVQIDDIAIDSESTAPGLTLEPNDYIRIVVSDTGVGIPADHIESIFEPYFTTKKAGEGTGMGLASIYGIIKQYGGEIAVESAINQGSTFRVYLPITRKKQQLIEKATEPLPTGDESVLVVDDEPAILKMNSQILGRLGYQVTERSNATDALALFESDPSVFDLVITDMTMPQITGDKLAMELLKLRPDIPIILNTGYSKKISDQTAAAIGIKAFVTKPVQMTDLATTVRKVLDSNKK